MRLLIPFLAVLMVAVALLAFSVLVFPPDGFRSDVPGAEQVK